MALSRSASMDLLVNREVTGQPTMTLFEAIEAGIVVPPALMRWHDWQKWRATPEGMRPMKAKGDPFTSGTKLEAKLWRETMSSLHGATWEEDLRAIPAEDLDNLDGASFHGGASAVGSVATSLFKFSRADDAAASAPASLGAPKALKTGTASGPNSVISGGEVTAPGLFKIMHEPKPLEQDLEGYLQKLDRSLARSLRGPSWLVSHGTDRFVRRIC